MRATRRAREAEIAALLDACRAAGPYLPPDVRSAVARLAALKPPPPEPDPSRCPSCGGTDARIRTPRPPADVLLECRGCGSTWRAPDRRPSRKTRRKRPIV